MEQRYDAVLGVILEGFSVTEVAQKFGVSRQSVHTWLQRGQTYLTSCPKELAQDNSISFIERGKVVGEKLIAPSGTIHDITLTSYFPA